MILWRSAERPELVAIANTFNILHVLIRESPKVVTGFVREELWGDEPPDSDTLRSHIYNLRRIIDRPFEVPLYKHAKARVLLARADSRIAAPDAYA
ncbi:MAG: hypothetical protein CM15mP120_05180 [Pseudomonadota bacterium]|nr:MAG: hypothetical protein CM15mP120_05180 [Pseudomonadota bacterium]